MPRDEEMTRAQAEAIVKDHEKKHGRDMSDRGPDRADDVPSQADWEEPPGWAKNGGRRPPHPDD